MTIASQEELLLTLLEAAPKLPLERTEHDDGSITLECRLPDRRLAFTIEDDDHESGWHLVRKGKAPMLGKLLRLREHEFKEILRAFREGLAT